MYLHLGQTTIGHQRWSIAPSLERRRERLVLIECHSQHAWLLFQYMLWPFLDFSTKISTFAG
jgi:hypothetical protein